MYSTIMQARPIDVISKFVIVTMTVIKNKTQATLIDPLKFVTVSLAAIMPNNWAVKLRQERRKASCKCFFAQVEMRCLLLSSR